MVVETPSPWTKNKKELKLDNVRSYPQGQLCINLVKCTIRELWVEQRNKQNKTIYVKIFWRERKPKNKSKVKKKHKLCQKKRVKVSTLEFTHSQGPDLTLVAHGSNQEFTPMKMGSS